MIAYAKLTQDRSSQVLLASGLIRKRIEDSEAQGTEFQREPNGGTKLALDEWKGRSKELLEFQFSPRFCCQANQQTNRNHLNTAFNAHANLPEVSRDASGTRDTKRAPFRHSHRWAALPRRDDRDAVGGARNWGADGAREIPVLIDVELCQQ